MYAVCKYTMYMNIFLTSIGPVTYRVVQVAAQDGTDPQPQVVTTTGLPAGAQVVVTDLVWHFS